MKYLQIVAYEHECLLAISHLPTILIHWQHIHLLSWLGSEMSIFNMDKNGRLYKRWAFNLKQYDETTTPWLLFIWKLILLMKLPVLPIKDNSQYWSLTCYWIESFVQLFCGIGPYCSLHIYFLIIPLKPRLATSPCVTSSIRMSFTH